MQHEFTSSVTEHHSTIITQMTSAADAVQAWLTKFSTDLKNKKFDAVAEMFEPGEEGVFWRDIGPVIYRHLGSVAQMETSTPPNIVVANQLSLHGHGEIVMAQCRSHGTSTRSRAARRSAQHSRTLRRFRLWTAAGRSSR